MRRSQHQSDVVMKTLTLHHLSAQPERCLVSELELIFRDEITPSEGLPEIICSALLYIYIYTHLTPNSVSDLQDEITHKPLCHAMFPSIQSYSRVVKWIKPVQLLAAVFLDLMRH